MRRDQLLERHVVEAEVVGVDDDLARGVDAAGDDDADALKLCRLDACRGKNAAHRLCQPVGHGLRALMREGDGGLFKDLQRIVHKTDLDIRSADVYADLIHGNLLSFFFSLLLPRYARASSAFRNKSGNKFMKFL